MRLQVAAEGMDPAQSDGRPRGRGQPKSKAEKLAARQKTRARARAHAERFREEYRQYRKASRLSRKQEARERAEAEAAWDVLQCMQRELPAPGAPVRARTSSSLMGLAGVALLGVTAFYEPSVMWAMAQEAGATPYPTPAMANLMTDQATALLAQLGPVCALARLVAPAPCASGFRAGLVTEAAAIQANTARLFVDPKVLGAGVCLKGETTGEKKERVALAQGSIVADYTAAAAAAQAFSSLLNGASWGLYAAGTALFAGEEAAQAAGAGATGLAGTADFDAQEVGDSLIGASYALQAAAGIYTMIGYDFGDYSAGYRLWANSVTKGLLKNCTGTFPAVSPSTGPPLSFTGYPSPIPAMEDAMLQLAAGCRLAQRQGLALPICSPATFNNLGARNSTLGPIAQGTSCLAFGVVPGTQSPCRLAPEADSRGRSDVSSKFAAFTAELNAAAAALQAVGDGLASGASGLTITGNAALRAGNATAADALLAAAGGLDTIGAVLFVDGYALVRTGALAQQVAAGITLKFNADSLAALNGRESTRASSTGAGTALNAIGTATGGPQAGTETGPGELASSGSDEDAGPYSVDSSVGGDGGAGPGPGAGTAGTAPVSSPESSSAVIVVPDSSTAPAEPSASAATRTTPLSLRGLVQRLLPPPPGAWPVHGEF
jgi:hypothetical protein